MPIKTSEKVKASKKPHGVSMLRITSVHFELWECQGWTSKRTRCFQVGLLEGHPIPSWTSDWLWIRSSATVWEAHILPLTKSMPIKISEKVKTFQKSHAVLSCLTSAESFITPDFVGTIPPRFPIDSEEGQEWLFQKVFADQDITKDNISPFWALRMSGLNLEKDKVLSSWTSGRLADSVMDFRRTFGEGQARLSEKVTSHLRQGQCRSGHQRRSVLRVTADKSNIHLCEGQGWTSKKSHGAFMLDLWKTARFRHGFPTDFWRRSSVTVCEAYILHMTKSMPIKISEKVKASRKSHTVLSCLTSAESFITPNFVGTIPLDSVRFRRLHPTDSTTIFDQADDYQENASLSVLEQVPHEKSRSSSRKSAAGTVPTAFGCWPLWRSRVNLEKDTSVLSNWTSGRPPDFVMDFRLTFEEGQARLFEKVTPYSWQSQCRSRYQRRSKHLEKVTRCSHAWPLQDLSLRLISLVRFRRDSRLTLKKVKSDCFRRSLPIRTSENINAKDNISPFWALRMSGLNLEKGTVLSSWTSGRPPDSVMDFRLNFEEGQARPSDKVDADQDIREGQCWG